jgi:hypothetical protein
MKTTIYAIAALCFLALVGFGQPPAPEPTTIQNHPKAAHPTVPRADENWPKAKVEDVASTEAVVAAYYAATSGPTGQPRDWDRFRSLFHPDAHLIAARGTFDGGAGAFVLGVNEYIQQNTKYFEKSGFIDSEAARRVESYGNIAQVWSTYESRRAAGADPYARGIASIQLLKDGGRWWIVSIFWDYERPDNPLPEKYKTTPKN